ncbi:MAG: gfo/Idh/MocA family oxidoreductase, partial [Lachnospiraceae bacterium]|nr:gfo/Idh/MocA family oxidoreductase [Lachnospiraceae bacterium]
YDYLCGTYTGSAISTIEESCEGHLMVFAAEESRRTGNVVDFRKYVDGLE